MSKLAGVSQNTINESDSTIINSKKTEPKKLLKEDDDDIFGDIGDLMGDEGRALEIKGKSEGVLTKDMKASMVLNNINQYEAANLKLSGEYKPKTLGARPEEEGGVEGTVIEKKPIQKLPGASREYGRLVTPIISPAEISRLKKAGMSQEEIDAIIEKDKKTKRSAVTFGQEGGNVQSAKWQPKIKDKNIISYHTFEENGKKLVGISDLGKQQLEFLQRMLSGRPLPANGDENIDIEEILLGNWPYKNLVIANAEHIIRDFYGKAVIPILAQTLKRKKNPKDSQFIVFAENGINHAIDQTKEKQYSQEKYNNYGAWFIQVVKHKVIDQLRSISDYVLDRTEVERRLVAETAPLVVDSKLNPEKAIEGNYEVTISPFTFKVKTKDGEIVKKPFFRYTFKDAMDAIGLFGAKEEDGKISPLSARFLKNPNEFYKSVSKDKPEDLTKAIYEPGEGSIAEKAMYEGVPVSEAMRLAKTEIDNILDEISIEMLSTDLKIGEKVRLERVNELLDPEKTKSPEIFQNLNSKKEYTVTKKEATGKNDKNGNTVYIYTILDDAGKEINLSNRYVKSTSKTSALPQELGTKYKDALIEALRLMLQYGRMVPKYTRTVYFRNVDGTPKIVNAYNPYTHKGGKVEKENGKIALPYKDSGLINKYQKIREVPFSYVWDTGGKLVGNTEKIIDQLSKVAFAKNIELPQNLFNPETKQALYKTAESAEEKKSLTDKTLEFINSLRLGLRKFFGFEGLENPAIKKDRDLLNDLLKNYEMSSQLSENHIRKVVRELMVERFKKTNK